MEDILAKSEKPVRGYEVEIYNSAVDKEIRLSPTSSEEWAKGIMGGGTISYVLDPCDEDQDYAYFQAGRSFVIYNPKDGVGNILIKNNSRTIILTLIPGQSARLVADVINEPVNHWRIAYLLNSSGAAATQYVHTFINTKTVAVTHDLGKIPPVTVYRSSDGKIIDGSPKYDLTDILNKLTLTFATNQTGVVVCG